MSLKIGDKKVGEGNPAYIIAEISGNHHQKYEEAAELVKVAAEAGADAVKLQTYTADTITLHSDKEWFVVSGEKQPEGWKKKCLWDLYKQAYTPWEWQPKLKELADSLGIALFSSPFDDSAVDFLEDMNVPAYKVASYEVIHLPLLKKIAQTGKPVIMSVGFASIEEIEDALKTLRENGANEIAILHCVTAYSDHPDPKFANLSTIEEIKKRFGVEAGFSDNNSGIEIPLIATTYAGGSLVEKHIILDKKLGGPDSKFSLEPDELKKMISLIRKYEKEGMGVIESVIDKEYLEIAMGHPQFGPASEQERENIVFRPALWVHKDIKKGEEFTKENTRVARPSAGLTAKHWDEVLGKKASKDIEAATPLSMDLVE